MARNDKLVAVDGAAIEARRLALGLTRDQFAAEAGMSANTLLATERSYRDPSERTAAKITSTLDRLEMGLAPARPGPTPYEDVEARLAALEEGFRELLREVRGQRR